MSRLPVRSRRSLIVEELEPRQVLNGLPANYVEVMIANDTQLNGGGLSAAGTYVFIQSKSNVYQIDSSFVANAVASPPSGNAPSSTLSSLKQSTVGGRTYYSFYLDSTLDLTSGRITFSNSPAAVQISGTAIQGPNPATANFPFDFVELTLTANSDVNLDTTQVDQFGMPIKVQVVPVDADFPNGTGIVPTLDRTTIINDFKTYTGNGTPFQNYNELANNANARIVAPQDYLSTLSQPLSNALASTFDSAVYNLFNYYLEPNGGGGNHLYLVGNGSNGPEIFDGQVITNFQVNGTGPAYTVFQFKGTGLYFSGSNTSPFNQLKSVTGGVTYEIFYPYFSTNSTNSPNNNALGVPQAPPAWWAPGFDTNLGNLNQQEPASQMVFAADGVFADNAYQGQFYSATVSGFDSKMLGNLENQLVTMLNRGITPATGDASAANNLQLREGYNTSFDLINVDLTQAVNFTQPSAVSPTSTQGASQTYLTGPGNVLQPPGQHSSIVWSTLTGSILYNGAQIQTFQVTSLENGGTFAITPTTVAGGNPFVTSATFHLTNGVIDGVIFNWNVPPDAGGTVKFSYEYGPTTLQPHFAILHLINPYAATSPPSYSFNAGDLGPSSNFSQGLRAGSPSDPTSGMTMTNVASSVPQYVYSLLDADDIIIYSPEALNSFSTNVLTLSDFYPTDSSDNPIGTWNAYSAFFHIGDPAHGVSAPTIDGRGYAFPFDDNGGYSSDIDVRFSGSGKVASVMIDLLAWNAKTVAAPVVPPAPPPAPAPHEVTGLVQTIVRQLRHKPWVFQVTVTNRSGAVLAGPLRLLLGGLTWSNLRKRQIHRRGAIGYAIYSLVADMAHVRLSDHGLSPQSSVTVQFVLRDPQGAPVTFHPRVVLGHL